MLTKALKDGSRRLAKMNDRAFLLNSRQIGYNKGISLSLFAFVISGEYCDKGTRKNSNPQNDIHFISSYL